MVSERSSQTFGARIAGVGHYVPDRIMTNAGLEAILDTSDEWIVSRTGMRERRYAEDDQASSDLATRAAAHALERANLVATDIDCYIVATVTPDFQFPATACIVASNLGAVGKAAFDIEIACSGFIYGLPIAASLVRSGVFRRVMIIGVDVLTRVTNFEDRNTAILFGDGSGAAIVERTAAERDCFLACELGADGGNPELLSIPAGGSRTPWSAEGTASHLDRISMSGREVFKHAVNKMVETSKNVLAAAGAEAADVAWVIPHQANMRIIEATMRRLDVPRERFVINIDRYGNTSAASIPIALSESIARGLIKAGDLILFTGFGGGLSWGSVAWRWDDGTAA